MADERVLKVLLKVAHNKTIMQEWVQCRKTYENLDLSQANLENLDLRDMNLSKVNLSAAKLFNANLIGVDLTNANLSYADLRRTELSNAYLTGANLSVANLEGANMIDTNLDHAILQGARMGGCHLIGASLVGADLERANLRGANLTFANIQEANFKMVNVEDANFTKVEIPEETASVMINFDKAIVSTKFKKATAGKHKITVEDKYEELFSERDCYKILGVGDNASLDDIAKAYRHKVQEYHPDKVNHLGEKLKLVAEREFERIQKAYRSLATQLRKPTMADGRKAIDSKLSKEMTIDDYQKLIKEEPLNDTAHYNLGTLYLSKGLTELAENAFKKALSINPNNEAAQYNLKLTEFMHSLSGS